MPWSGVHFRGAQRGRSAERADGRGRIIQLPEVGFGKRAPVVKSKGGNRAKARMGHTAVAPFTRHFLLMGTFQTLSKRFGVRIGADVAETAPRSLSMAGL
jgi:hypothetical protein